MARKIPGVFFVFLGAVRAKIITELILERVGPVISKSFLLEFMAFRLIQ